jgi:hypothetical protein
MSNGLSCGSSRRSSSTTSASRKLVVNYFAYIARLSASARRVAHRDYLSRGNTGFTSSTPHTAATSSSGRITSTIHLD